ncbi:uncharacterized protein C8Q71DRAFT_292628 [Rhodofomes roseus]|uniref:Uncharacterized protein n=1 Tax=Rhodofomes roseus TaxID=34475 RepID=A0ABQ8K406_9APHY|nr:uncharacterized protein C8Q71DRAFT_292628 [Rhodofomes roseus]KAH9831569.1 hypothetical protein C8Q71DRAFT_292628 [Rhodofomes roseus]
MKVEVLVIGCTVSICIAPASRDLLSFQFTVRLPHVLLYRQDASFSTTSHQTHRGLHDEANVSSHLLNLVKSRALRCSRSRSWRHGLTKRIQVSLLKYDNDQSMQFTHGKEAIICPTARFVYTRMCRKPRCDDCDTFVVSGAIALADNQMNCVHQCGASLSCHSTSWSHCVCCAGSACAPRPWISY